MGIRCELFSYCLSGSWALTNYYVKLITNLSLGPYPPQSTDDCWLMKCTASDSAGYPKKAIAGRGGGNRWIVHRVWFFVLVGLTVKNEVEDQNLVCAHRCGRGRYTETQPYACINPHHITACTQEVNLSHDFDRNSCAQWCTHNPKCIYTNEAGTYLSCRNSIPLVHPCRCTNNCFNAPSPSPSPILPAMPQSATRSVEELEEEAVLSAMSDMLEVIEISD